MSGVSRLMREYVPFGKSSTDLDTPISATWSESHLWGVENNSLDIICVLSRKAGRLDWRNNPAVSRTGIAC